MYKLVVVVVVVLSNVWLSLMNASYVYETWSKFR